MAKDKKGERTTTKPLAWLHGEIKTPPFTEEGRREAGYLLRLLQQGERLGMPQAEPFRSLALAAERSAFVTADIVGGSCIASIPKPF